MCSPARRAHHRLVISRVSSELGLAIRVALNVPIRNRDLLRAAREATVEKNIFTPKWRASWALFAFESHRSSSRAPSQLICGREREKNAAQHLLFFFFLLNSAHDYARLDVNRHIRPLTCNTFPLLPTFRRFFSIYLERELTQNRPCPRSGLVFPPHSSTTPCWVLLLWPIPKSYQLQVS